MDERTLQLRVGVVVVASVTIAAILIIFFQGRPVLWQRQYEVILKFDAAPGVEIDTPVRKHGILIGRVTKVRLQDDGVLVNAKLDEKYPVTESEVCRISAGSLFGDRVLEFVPGPDESTELIKDGDYIEQTEVSSDVFQVLVNLEGQMKDAIDKIGTAGQDVSELSNNLNTLVAKNDDQLLRIMQKSETALDRFDQAMDAIEGFAGDEELRERLRESLESLPELLLNAQEMVSSMKAMADRADKNLMNLEGITQPLGERGEIIVANVEQSTKSLEMMLAQLAELSRRLENPDGTVGQLINNPDLYHKLDRAATNIEEITRKLRPIIDDARVFADKIARNPNRLGVQGALDKRRSGTKFYYGDYTREHQTQPAPTYQFEFPHNAARP
jgi:phospholipid/cholesterol/gamma-HCH transport system substrate-binding protein